MSQYYKKYMKKREEEKPGYLKLFFGAFIVMVIFFVIAATHFSSSVDTTIGENDEGDTKESGIGVKHLIDSRLRFIQMEDASAPKIKQTPDSNTTVQNEENPLQEESDAKSDNTYAQEQTGSVYASSNQNRYGNTPATVDYTETKSDDYTSNTYTTAPTPAAQLRTNSASTTSPAHNIQRNFTPTGMN